MGQTAFYVSGQVTDHNHREFPWADWVFRPISSDELPDAVGLRPGDILQSIFWAPNGCPNTDLDDVPGMVWGDNHVALPMTLIMQEVKSYKSHANVPDYARVESFQAVLLLHQEAIPQPQQYDQHWLFQEPTFDLHRAQRSFVHVNSMAYEAALMLPPLHLQL